MVTVGDSGHDLDLMRVGGLLSFDQAVVASQHAVTVRGLVHEKELFLGTCLATCFLIAGDAGDSRLWVCLRRAVL